MDNGSLGSDSCSTQTDVGSPGDFCTRLVIFMFVFVLGTIAKSLWDARAASLDYIAEAAKDDCVRLKLNDNSWGHGLFFVRTSYWTIGDIKDFTGQCDDVRIGTEQRKTYELKPSDKPIQQAE